MKGLIKHFTLLDKTYLLTTMTEADRPLSIPWGEGPGFSDLGGTFGLVMVCGLAVAARLDLGPTEVFLGTTVTEIQNILRFAVMTLTLN